MLGESLSCIWWTQNKIWIWIALIRYVYQVHRLLENTSTSAPFRPFLQYLQNYSSCYVKLAFMLKKKKFTKNLHKILWSTVQKYVQSHGNQFHFFLTQLLNYYMELKSVNSWSFIHVRPKAAAESASVVTSRLWSRLKVTVYGLKQSESAPNERFGIWAGNEPQAASWFFFRWHWNIYFLI